MASKTWMLNRLQVEPPKAEPGLMGTGHWGHMEVASPGNSCCLARPCARRHITFFQPPSLHLHLVSMLFHLGDPLADLFPLQLPRSLSLMKRLTFRSTFQTQPLQSSEPFRTLDSIHEQILVPLISCCCPVLPLTIISPSCLNQGFHGESDVVHISVW